MGDLFIKNGSTFKCMAYNMERADWNFIFYGAHFAMLQTFAIQILPPSDFLTLVLHRYGIHDWFASNAVKILNPAYQSLADSTATGWRHWNDCQRTLKIIGYAL